MGDPNGVGPEIVVRGFAGGILPGDTFVYGDAAALRVVTHTLGMEELPGDIEVVDCGVMSPDQISPGELSEAAGAASIEYVRRATEDAMMLASEDDDYIRPAVERL
jgi:4-hydroxy-L-threonine phosphate dehydrogenase PdxA